MALYATNRFPGDGATTSYEFNFVGKYIARSHVKVYQEDNATKVRTYVSINDGNFLNDTTLRNLPVTPVGSTLVICRETPKPPLVDFVNGSRFTEYNMDLVARQGLFVAMEAMDAGDLDARQQLLDAIAVVVGLVNDATAAVSDATAAAAAAATSALAASDSATQAQTARTGAEAANTAAQTAKTDAQTAATNAASSASSASTSASTASTQASNAATSASTANTRANAANTSANNAATSATNAANSATAASNSATAAGNSASAASTSADNAAASATNAANSATAAANAAASVVGQGRMCCRVVVANAASRILRLERLGGQVMSINGVLRTIPAGGVTLPVANLSTPRYLYAFWNGSSIGLMEDTAHPTFDSTLGQWIYPGNANYTPVAYFRGNMLTQPERFLRNYYNAGPAHYTQHLAASYNGTWNGADQRLITMPMLLLPGDTIDLVGTAAIMSHPAARVGDMTIRLSTAVLSRSRHTHQGGSFGWHTYTGQSRIQRGAGAADPAQEAVFELWYLPISADGNSFEVAGGIASTQLSAIITPYRWA